MQTSDIEQDTDQAFNYYLQAARLGCRQAWPSLERLAEEGDYQKRQQLARLYQEKGNLFKANYWREQRRLATIMAEEQYAELEQPLTIFP